MTITPILPHVRVAGPADETELYRLLLLSHAENAIFPHSNERVQWYVRRFIYSKHLPPEDMGPRGCFGVIGPVGRLEAVIMVGIGNFWYTEQRHLEEWLVFVDPNFRRGHHGAALLEWLKNQYEKTSLPALCGIMTNSRTEAKCRLYRRRMPKIGEYFLWPPDFFADQMTGKPQLVQSSSRAA